MLVRTYSFSFLVFVAVNGFSQKDSAFFYYEAGLQAFNEQHYRESDSLYTISLKIKGHPDAYFNRAITRLSINDQSGYCEDICNAASLGDRECDTLFRKECGSADTAFFDTENRAATRLNHSFYSVVYQSDYPYGNLVVKFDKKAKRLDVQRYVVEALPGSGIEVLPEFNGGKEALLKFITINIKLPPEVKSQNISGQVVVGFVVNRLGFLENIRLLKGLNNCEACNQEAIRLVSAMPRWKPGILKGKTAKCFYNCPFIFNGNN